MGGLLHLVQLTLCLIYNQERLKFSWVERELRVALGSTLFGT